ncbi:type II CRISPR RNA-guided endonuclease Cas9 [Pedobacter sp. SD-b]|uniref:CRISPR-associated endonuclease Cas9 n=1 Tax=Pedobacter segetis TaxID=2793069 RepID=A0ABS1BG73_9SPHI|nr:type II CRISPR RNA-guided endonuclease Cas9 [Pedobacter segetis]MBK0381838.1 type II CRISPR RNA-guided endonuclease Cas9 [Pedobacter segetis]
MKKILGLDLGTTSIGWAFVNEAETEFEVSSIEKIGARIIQYENFSKVDKNGKVTESKNPESDFSSGKGLSPNADRTLKRSARRNLQRYKLRRENLIQILKEHHLLNSDSILAEDGKNTTHETYALRAKAATEEISKEEFCRVLLMINKKRGYKSSRKINNKDENDGQAIDGMTVAKQLYEENITPGEYAFKLLKNGKKDIPDFYRSDLQSELDKIWEFQKQFYPEILTEDLKKAITGQGKEGTRKRFLAIAKTYTAEAKGTREDKKSQAYQWRCEGLTKQLSIEEVAFVITEINSNINSSSGYLGAISDRSKELYFNKQTVGEYLYQQLQKSQHNKLKNQVFYRQDYLDEFETIWEKQAQFHQELTPELKVEIRDVVIFYQRKLKSQKGLVSLCEFENKIIEVESEGLRKQKKIGLKVAPKSSPLFQEFKIWQNLNNLKIKNKLSGEIRLFDSDSKQLLFNELNIKGNLSKDSCLEILGYKPRDYELNFSTLEGNRTNQALYKAYFKMMELEGHDEIEWLNMSSKEIKDTISSFFQSQNISTKILYFNAELDGKGFEKQESYQLWHLLYSYVEDDSFSGNELLYKLLEYKFGFKNEFAKVLANVTFQADYGNLSAKAIRNIYPFIKELHYDKACLAAKYRHSASSLTKEEIENKILKDKLELLPKNSLRNPVVEKILNQMVNVVNAIIAEPSLGKPDEIRIELARELKKNAKEREEMTSNINSAKLKHDKIREILVTEFNVPNPTRNDIIRYKLYEELKFNGYKDLYTNEYVQKNQIFSKLYDVDHIIPQSRLFDDSFSNKVLVPRLVNLDKGNKTAADYILDKYGEEKLLEFTARIEMLHQENYKNNEEGISKAKLKKLKLKGSEIGEGFIDRDLRDSQYIAKKARYMLQEICKTVTPTTGSITDRLREDWDLINVMQELNFSKYKSLGLTEMVEKKDGSFKERIIDWTKRNDHRHHAMDALTIAFTKHSHIQFLNNLNARYQENKISNDIKGIEEKETVIIKDDEGNKQRKFKCPLNNFREEAKKHLENVLISQKAKNKVVTKNKNKTKSAKGEQSKTELTPRGQLHKETVYSKYKIYKSKEEKISAKFDEQTINMVGNPKEKEALLKRLREYDGDPKKAFTGKNSPTKNPIYLDAEKTVELPEKVKLTWLEDDFSIRKDITPENFKDLKSIEKVVDEGIKRILIHRLEAFNSNPKEAFSNLDKNPIWLNEAKGISIKKTKISGVKNAEALHHKIDHLGNLVLDDDGKTVPSDYVSTGNNHHVAIYKDKNGDLQEKVVSFYEAVERVNQKLPIIDKSFNQDLGWQFLFSMKQNEYFVFTSENFDPNEYDLLNPDNNNRISPNLFRVQKIATKNYMFRHHLETNVDTNKILSGHSYFHYQSTNLLKNIIKVRINHIGQIVKIGEY